MTLTAAFNHFNFFRHETAAPRTPHYHASNPYLVLGIRHNSPDTDIKRAWRKLMMANHPDLGGDAVKTQAINAAYREICKRRGI